MFVTVSTVAPCSPRLTSDDRPAALIVFPRPVIEDPLTGPPIMAVPPIMPPTRPFAPLPPQAPPIMAPPPGYPQEPAPLEYVDADATLSAVAPPAPGEAKATQAERAVAKPTAAPPSAQGFVLVSLMGHLLLVLHQLLHTIVPEAGEDPSGAGTAQSSSSTNDLVQTPSVGQAEGVSFAAAISTAGDAVAAGDLRRVLSRDVPQVSQARQGARAAQIRGGSGPSSVIPGDRPHVTRSASSECCCPARKGGTWDSQNGGTGWTQAADMSEEWQLRRSVCGSRRQGPTGATILTIGVARATGSLIGGGPLGSERVAMWAMVVSGDVRRIVEMAAVARGDREAPACVRGLGPCDDMAPASRSGLRVGL